MKNNEEHIKEYESYVQSILRSSFDYSTWHEHQYGIKPEIKVETSFQINVLSDKGSAK
jgi:hypothetical protein